MPSYNLYCPQEEHKYTESKFAYIADFDEEIKGAKCPICGGFLKQDISGGCGVVIPPHMSASESGTYHDAKTILSRGKRPSGREKIYF